MARVEQQRTGKVWENPDEIRELLDNHGILYERWDIAKLDGTEKPDDTDEQSFLLDLFSDEIARISNEQGYATADVVALKPDTENLEGMLAKFDKEHTHAEDEVRFTVAGSGIFAIRGKDDEMYSVEVHPGDLLAVPEGIQHYFTLTDEKRIQCIRLFTDKGGWVADYVDGGSSAADIGK